jgi:nicotinate-nucleotide adenylyltransferase
MPAERLGVFGGTFDPVHVGHVVAAVEARRALELDRVLMVVSGDPWQKRGNVAAAAEDRLAMVQAAVAGIERIEACDLEVRRTGPSYTVETLEALTRPGRSLFLVVGADVAATLHTWTGVEGIPALVTLAIVDRAGVPPAPDPAGPWRVERLSIPRLEISSTDLRARAGRGWPLDGLVPPGAIRIVRERSLYRRSNPGGGNDENLQIDSRYTGEQ